MPCIDTITSCEPIRGVFEFFSSLEYTVSSYRFQSSISLLAWFNMAYGKDKICYSKSFQKPQCFVMHLWLMPQVHYRILFHTLILLFITYNIVVKRNILKSYDWKYAQSQPNIVLGSIVLSLLFTCHFDSLLCFRLYFTFQFWSNICSCHSRHQNHPLTYRTSSLFFGRMLIVHLCSTLSKRRQQSNFANQQWCSLMTDMNFHYSDWLSIP